MNKKNKYEYELFTETTYSEEEHTLKINSCIFTFFFDEASVILQVLLDSHSNSIAVTNIATLPEKQAGNGYGSFALKEWMSFDSRDDINIVKAMAVIKKSESFWLKNGFTKLNDDENNFVYKMNEKK